jgi:predicted PurR-regulated permease PerM
MLELDGRALRVVWTVFLFGLLIALLYLTRHTLVIFTLAIFLAHLLAPLVDRVQRLIPRRVSRTVALAIVYLALVGAALAILIPIGSKIAEQASALAGRLPGAFQEDLLSRVPLPSWLEVWRPRLTDFLREQTIGIGDQILPMLKDLGPGILAGLGALAPVVLIPILSFFFLKDGHILHTTLVECVRPHQRSLLEDILADLHLLVAQYIRALVLLAIATFVSYSVFLGMTGVPYSILLAGVAGVLELIPVIGPLTGAIVTLLVAGLSGYDHLLWILIFLIVYRLFQDYVLSPQLLSSGIEIHPLLVLFGVLAGEQVAGIPGMFFSALRIVIVRMRRQQTHA